jgi:hypothetical protein
MHYLRGEGSKTHSKEDRVAKCTTQEMVAQKHTKKRGRAQRRTERR